MKKFTFGKKESTGGNGKKMLISAFSPFQTMYSKICFTLKWLKYKILDMAKLKAFADDIEHITQVMIFIFDMVENIVGKGETAVYQHFFPFLQCFQKAFLSRSVKVGIV